MSDNHLDQSNNISSNHNSLPTINKIENIINNHNVLNTYSCQKIIIEEVFSDAFDRSKGFKGKTFIAILIIFLCYLPLIAFQVLIEGYTGGPIDFQGEVSPQQFGTLIFNQLLMMLFATPLGVGFALMALKQMRSEPANATEVFKHFKKIIPLFITMILMYVLLILGFMLFILPGIYLLVAYYFCTMLVADKGLSPWQALEASRKAVTKQWFTVLICFIGVGLFNLVALIPLGIGLIWSIPWSLLVYARIYQLLFDGNHD